MSYPADWQETLVAASTAATASLQLPNSMIHKIYTEYSSNYSGGLGASLKINVPTVDIANASDIGNGSITGVAPAESTVTLTIGHKYSSNRKIATYDETLSANQLSQVYVQPVIEEVVRKLDNAICAQVVTGSFTTNASVTGGADIFTRANLATAWAQMRATGVPLGDPSMTTFITHPLVVGNMMAATEFANESVVGINAAQVLQRQAKILPQFGFELIDDPYMPVNTGAYSALAFHKYAIGLRIAVPTLINAGVINQTVVFPVPNVPVVVETFYDALSQARYIHAFVICGHGVVRESLANFLVST